MEDKLYNTEELSAYLGVPVRTLEAWRNRREGPDYIRLPKGVRYAPSAVQAWIDARVAKVSK